MGKKQTERRYVGIDFGTSTTLISTRQSQHSARTAPTTVLPLGTSNPWIPSVIGIRDDGSIAVGADAEESLLPHRVIRSLKAGITSGETTLQLPDGEQVVEARIAISAFMRGVVEVARRIEPSLFEDATVRLGCPALWTGEQRQMLVDAMHDAGIDCEIGDVIDEPVAAGISWIEDQWRSGGSRPTGKIIVFDVGGGTLDVALLNVEDDDGSPHMTVLASEGHAFAGDALDRAIMWELLPQLGSVRDTPFVRQVLLLRARAMKEELSTRETSELILSSENPVQLTFDRDQLAKLLQEHLDRADRLLLSVLRSSLMRVAQPPAFETIRAMGWDELAPSIQHVAVVGGMGNVPGFRRHLQERFPNASVALATRPQQSVAHGLALSENVFKLNLPRPPFDFVVEYATEDGSPLPERYRAWEEANRYIYRAFSPLYEPRELVTKAIVQYRKDIPPPPGFRGWARARIFCVAPDSRRTRVQFVNEDRSVVYPYIDALVSEQGGQRGQASFCLRPNGSLFVGGRRPVAFKVKEWVPLIGPNHSYRRDPEPPTGWEIPMTEPHYE